MAQTKKSTGTRRKTATKRAQKASVRYQTAAVLLLAAAVLSACLAVIPGASLWGLLHTGLMGLCGTCAYLLPFFLLWLAVVCAKEKKSDHVNARLWQLVVLLLLIAAAIGIFVGVADGKAFGAAYRQTIADSWGAQGFFRSGVIGALFSYPMVYLFTETGAKIIICLLIFVFVMLITGTTVLYLFHLLITPVEKTREGIATAISTGTENFKNSRIDVNMGSDFDKKEPARRKRSRIDIPVDDPQNLPEPAEETPAPVKEETPVSIPEVPATVNEKAPAAEDKKEPVPEAEPAEEAPAEENAYRYPPISLLDERKPTNAKSAAEEQRVNADLLVKTLKEFGVSTTVLHISRGPTVTRYELQPSAGVKISRITGLSDDIALRLATSGVRIEAPIPNKAAVGIEVPNKVSSSVSLRELIDSQDFRTAKSHLTVALGRDIAGQIVLADLAKMPHLLIAGTTGSGKSVCTNSMIQSVLYRAAPSEVRLLLIDPKQVEFGVYNGIPHLLVPVVTDPRKAAGALGWAVTEMLNRYKTFAENNVRDLTSYNELARQDDNLLRTMPQILIIIDELADLMMAAASAVEDSIIRLAQMARAAGMHLVIATQRPSVDVITGLIKANIPSRLALTVASAVDSRTILDTGGADKLLGKGDMLFMPVGFSKPMRVQGCFVSNKEVERVVGYLKEDGTTGEYNKEILEEIDRQAAATGKSSSSHGGGENDGEDAEDSTADEMLPQAIEVVVEAGMASTSLLQRRLRLGYARAGRIIDEMEQRGIVGPHEGSKPRKVLLTRQQWAEMTMNRPDMEPHGGAGDAE